MNFKQGSMTILANGTNFNKLGNATTPAQLAPLSLKRVVLPHVEIFGLSTLYEIVILSVERTFPAHSRCLGAQFMYEHRLRLCKTLQFFSE